MSSATNEADWTPGLCQGFGSRHIVWVGALSFERRCLGSLRSLLHDRVFPSRAVVLDYRDSRKEDDPASSRRAENLAKLHEMLSTCPNAPVLEATQLSPYRADELERCLSKLGSDIEESRNAVVLDITCVTKIHALVLASAMARRPLATDMVLAYTLPDNYSSFAERKKDLAGFSYALVAPLVDGAKLGSESNARGIIVPGHENQRLLVALAEVDPSGGSVIRASTEFRPDFESVTKSRNRKLMTELLERKTWAEQRIDFRSYTAVVRLVHDEIQTARRAEAPVFLYPFGPKSIIYAAGSTMAKEYPERSWFVYPAPRFYDVDYTEGIAQTYWKRVAI